MQRQVLPASQSINPSPQKNSLLNIPLQYVQISNTLNEHFVEVLYAQQGLLNIYFDSCPTQDFIKYFYSNRYHLSKLKINALALNTLSLKIIELIVSTLLAKPNLELKLISISNLEEGALRMLYDLLLYLAHKNQIVMVDCGDSISHQWQLKFHGLLHPHTLASSISKEFFNLMRARFSDRSNFSERLNELESVLIEGQEANLNYNAQLASKSKDYDALSTQIQALTRGKEQLEKESAAKESELLAQMKSLQDQLNAQRADNKDLIQAAKEKEQKLESKITQLQIQTDLLNKQVAQIDERFPALFSVNSLMRTVRPDTIAQLQNNTSPKKQKPDTESKVSDPEEKNHESLYVLLRAAERKDSQLKETLRLKITTWLANRFFASKLQCPVGEYIQQQLEIAEVIIAHGTSFYAITDGKAESIYHYLAFILCNIPNAPKPYQDHLYERKVLLQTLANALEMIEVLHNKFVSQGITVSAQKVEIFNLKADLAKLIKQQQSNPALTGTSSSATTSVVRQLPSYGLFNTVQANNIPSSTTSQTNETPPDIVVPHRR